jgi:DNA-binding MarR family transcriptional regulator
MERRGLISRARESRDRRMVTTRITSEARKIVDRLDEPIRKIHNKQLGHLGKERLRLLEELLAAARAATE